MTRKRWQDQVKAAVDAMDQAALDALILRLVISDRIPPTQVEHTLRQAVAVASHEVHVWWQGPCNCTGRLN